MKNLIITIFCLLIIAGGAFTSIEFVASSTHDLLRPISHDESFFYSHRQASLPKFRGSFQTESNNKGKFDMKESSFLDAVKSPQVKADGYADINSMSYINFFSKEDEKKRSSCSGVTSASSTLGLSYTRDLINGESGTGISVLSSNGIRFFPGDISSVSTLDFSDLVLAPAEEGQDDLYELPLKGGEFVLLLLVGLYAIVCFYIKFFRNVRL